MCFTQPKVRIFDLLQSLKNQIIPCSATRSVFQVSRSQYSSYLINYQINIILNFSVSVNWCFTNVNYSKILHLYEMKVYTFSMTWSK